VLAFVGLKMVWLNQLFDGKFPITISLAIIGGIIGASVVLSLLFPRQHHEAAEAGAGAEPPAGAELKERRNGRKSDASKETGRKKKRKRPSLTVRILRKAIAIYLLLLGLGLILRAAFGFSL
jgi:hypothetical protein